MTFKTEASEENQTVLYEVNGEKYESYYLKVSKDALLVFLVHDWNGINDYAMKRAGMLNELGYSVFLIDMYGKGVRAESIEEKMNLTGMLYNDRKKMRQLLSAAYDKARQLGANVQNAVIMGYCFGGTVALEFARTGIDLKSFISFHGGLKTPEGQDYSKTKGEILVFHGSADTMIPIEEFTQLVKELEAFNVNHEMTTYSGAPHAFTVFGTENYREVADKRAWKRLIEYLQEIEKVTS
ncbi:dienelactone hydrolase family protein [Thermodesulfovibrio thiophilus]|uniref:dienelactone hydrolase family protein n=1 Tax=Thermodesulfovibrio thiophilus TaxID=340095 RepID=UPI000409E5F6|nr:dienelactone hydrolase family protein [Thermodesulfovibrio thiophilus]